MKILMLSHYYSPHKGGVEKHLLLLSRELLKRKHSITVITEQHNLDIPLEEVIEGVRVIRIPYFAIDSKRMVWTWMSQHDYLINESNVVHIHDVYWWYWPSRIMWLFKPVFVTFHGYEGVGLPRMMAVIQRRIAEKVSTGSICIGDFMRRWYKATPTIVSYGASIIHKKSSVIIDDKTSVFIGRYDYDTGIDVYIDAVKSLKRIKRLDCYGDGPLLAKVQQRCNSKIFIHPWNDNANELAIKYRYVFVSRYLSILEAMQVGRLVVAVYNNEIKRDYLMCHPMKDNMIIAGSVDELVEKMNDIMDHPEKEKVMVEKAYTWAKEQTWEKLADQYEQLWAR